MKSSAMLKRVSLCLLLMLCFVLAAPVLPGTGSALSVQAAQKKSSTKILYTSGNLKLIEKNKKVCCYVNGKKVKKTWKTIDGHTYYFGKNGNAVTGTQKIGKKYYCFDKQGHRRTGFIKNKKGTCYYSEKDGHRVSGWNTIDGKQYYFGKNACYVKGRNKIKKKYYLFSSEGVLFKDGWHTESNGKIRYYSKDDGHMLTGVQLIDGKKYGFGSNGYLVKNSWLGDSYFGADGVLVPEKKSGIAPLRSRVSKTIRSFPGTWSVYVKNMKTGESFCLNNRPMYAASVIKLFAMGAAYQRVADGKLSLGSVSGLISTMIADSNNSAFNSIVKMIGRTYVNTWCKAHGFTQTSQVHGLSPADNNSGIRIASGDNVTSVSDCGRFLESVYNGTCVNRTYSKKMVANLKKITRDKSLYYRSKLPTGIPSSAVCANKTGDLNDYAHDCAIVYGKKTDYVICVMAHVPGRGYSCSSYYRKLSSMVYNFFN